MYNPDSVRYKQYPVGKKIMENPRSDFLEELFPFVSYVESMREYGIRPYKCKTIHICHKKNKKVYDKYHKMYSWQEP